jgi:hypothetical protein
MFLPRFEINIYSKICTHDYIKDSIKGAGRALTILKVAKYKQGKLRDLELTVTGISGAPIAGVVRSGFNIHWLKTTVKSGVKKNHSPAASSGQTH